MKVGSIVKNANSIGMLAAICVFINLRMVLEVNAFLSMIFGLGIGLVVAFRCEKFGR